MTSRSPAPLLPAPRPTPTPETNPLRAPAAGEVRSGRDGIAVAVPGGRAHHSRSMSGYTQRDDGWDDNASVGLA
ncbi:hypothetical protein [Streptomyces olivaceoviridis]|uniref:hypothetical protein n=1 Tax=Streptomyces olivaceoviridis TaxID=1921 RepID=UPI0036F70CB1